MKNPVFFMLITAVVLTVISCQTVIFLGDKNFAAFMYEEIYFSFDLNIGFITAENTVNERMNVRVQQERNKGWFPIFDVELRRSDEDNPFHVQDNVDFDRGNCFSLAVKRRNEQNWSTIFVRLERDETGQLRVVQLPDTT